MDRQKSLSTNFVVRALCELEHYKPEKTEQVKIALNTINAALEFQFQRGICPPEYCKQYRVLRRREEKRSKKMLFEIDLTKGKAEYREKNNAFFNLLEEGKKVVYVQCIDDPYNHCDNNPFFDLLGIGDDVRIPVGEFCGMIGFSDRDFGNEEKYSMYGVIKLLKSKGIEVTHSERWYDDSTEKGWEENHEEDSEIPELCDRMVFVENIGWQKIVFRYDFKNTNFAVILVENGVEFENRIDCIISSVKVICSIEDGKIGGIVFPPPTEAPADSPLLFKIACQFQKYAKEKGELEEALLKASEEVDRHTQPADKG